MVRRLLAAAAVVSLVVLGATTAHARAVTPAPAVATHPLGGKASPLIGYVYAGGPGADGTSGLTVFAQHANGALTPVHYVPEDGSDQRLVVVHLRTGLALYDLSKDTLNAYRINQSTGALTSFKIPQPTSPVSSLFGLAGYDPLAHGLPGQPLLFTGSCGNSKPPAAAVDCRWRSESFLVNPKTGALAKSTVGPTSPYEVGNAKIVGDGLGRFALGLYDDSDGHNLVVMFRVKVSGGTTAAYGVVTRTVLDKDSATHYLGIGNTMVITSEGVVGFPSGLADYPDHPSGWLSYAFGSVKGAPIETRLDSTEGTSTHEPGIEADTSVQGRKWVFIGEIDGGSGDFPSTECAIEGLRPLNPGAGLSHARTYLPCTGSDYNFINSLYAQGGFVYAGMYPGGVYGFKDSGTPYLTPTAQKRLPDAGQIYGWAGFVKKPSVKVAAKLSLKQGIVMTITCPEGCSGSASARVNIAGSGVHVISSQAIKAHAAGTFKQTLPISKSLHKTIAAAIKKQHLVTVTTRVTLVAFDQKVTDSAVSHMHA